MAKRPRPASPSPRSPARGAAGASAGAPSAKAERSALRTQMREEAEAARAALESMGFTPEAFDNITERAAIMILELRDAGARSAAARLDRLMETFDDALHTPVSDPGARGRAYLALLDAVLLQSLVAEAPSPRWLKRIDRECEALEAGDPDASLALLTVADIAAEVGATVTPGESGLITSTWDRWRFGLVAGTAATPGEIATRVADASQRLIQDKVPGLVVLDLAGPVCPEQRPLRATHPDAGAGELRARLDRLLAESRDTILASCDRDHVLGVVGAAFLSLHLVAAGQVAFITAYRMMPLIDEGDPRGAKLRAFREAFGDI